MNVNTTIKPAANLADKLDQAGHLWAVEELAKTFPRDLWTDEHFQWEFAESVQEQSELWLKQSVSLDEAWKLTADLTIRLFNLDIDGRSKNLPPNRAQVVQK